jgi:hypothetical protein
MNSKAATGQPVPTYLIRRLTPEDAAGVTELVRCIYGDSYQMVHPEIYQPDQIIRLNENDELVSIVALDAAGKVVGHYALERPEPSNIAEAGEAMVRPEHRHHQLMERMRAQLEEEAHRLSLAGIFGQAVTNHLFTQKAQEHCDSHPCGVSLGVSPASFHNMPEPLTQRMSDVLYFKYLRRPAQVVVHVPNHHQEICTRIYGQFKVPAQFGDPVATQGPGKVTLTAHPERQRGTIRVRRVGEGMAAEIRRLRRQLCEAAGAEVVYLELPLAQAGTPDLCRAAEQDGFFFSGVGPCFAPDGDALRLQFLTVKLDTALLQVENPMARELVAYVDRERARLGQGHAY